MRSRRLTAAVGGIIEVKAEDDPWRFAQSTIVYQVDVDFILSCIVKVIWVVFDTLYDNFASSAANVKTNSSKFRS